MNKTLYLVRHAKSDWSIPGEKDFERTLNSRGYTDAPRVGRELFEKGVKPDLIISSPAHRAKLTAEFVAEQLKYDTSQIVFVEEIYESSVRTLLSIINKTDEKYKKLMVFGHNPTLSYLAESLTKEEIGNIPTCGVIEIIFKEMKWEEVSSETGKLSFFIYPKNIS